MIAFCFIITSAKSDFLYWSGFQETFGPIISPKFFAVIWLSSLYWLTSFRWEKKYISVALYSDHGKIHFIMISCGKFISTSPYLLGSSILRTIFLILFIALFSALAFNRAEKKGSSSFISRSSIITFHWRSGMDSSLYSVTLVNKSRSRCIVLRGGQGPHLKKSLTSPARTWTEVSFSSFSWYTPSFTWNLPGHSVHCSTIRMHTSSLELSPYFHSFCRFHQFSKTFHFLRLYFFRINWLIRTFSVSIDCHDHYEK